VALATFIWALFSRLEGRIDRLENEVREVRSSVSRLEGRVDELSGLTRQLLAARAA
jgi:hypothetical protein